MKESSAVWTLQHALEDQKDWSEATFGRGKRTLGIIRHIEKELNEIRANPDDLEEWVDVILLAMDGYWRHGGKPKKLLSDLTAKQARNRARKYPPVGVPEDQPVEHLKSKVAGREA